MPFLASGNAVNTADSREEISSFGMIWRYFEANVGREKVAEVLGRLLRSLMVYSWYGWAFVWVVFMLGFDQSSWYLALRWLVIFVRRISFLWNR